MLSAAATTLTSAALAPKSVVKVLPKPRAHWVGDGFHVHPILGSLAFSGAVSPFLLLDYAAPKHFPPTAKRLGVGQHPHRGFETVTIAFQGQVEHADSLGNTDTIGVGDVQAKTHTDFSPLVVTPHCSHRSRHLVRVQHAQWMTAGRGIIHEEFHARSFAKQGGTFEMVQLWASLPPTAPIPPTCHTRCCPFVTRHHVCT
jgi:redox-sensitive bicupin YhaK (pirin superfamily)